MDEICKNILKKEVNIKMAGKITNFLREFQLFFSSILTIVGLIIALIGITGMWFKEIAENIFNFKGDLLDWSLYLLILGFIVLAFGIWYLYTYLKDRKFILEEMETNKRSELLKKHTELKIAVKHMPSKYKKMLKDKEDELNIR